jgi:hypothetical protein
MTEPEQSPLNGVTLEHDLRELQGKWECIFREGEADPCCRAVKEVQGNTDKVTSFLPTGEVYRVTLSVFVLGYTDGCRTLSYVGKILEGDHQGDNIEGNYKYELEGGIWREIYHVGLFKFENWDWKTVHPPESLVFTWRRV